MIDEQNYDFVGDFDSAWKYYHEKVSDEETLVKPEYLGEENGEQRYGIRHER